MRDGTWWPLPVCYDLHPHLSTEGWHSITVVYVLVGCGGPSPIVSLVDCRPLECHLLHTSGQDSLCGQPENVTLARRLSFHFDPRATRMRCTHNHPKRNRQYQRPHAAPTSGQQGGAGSSFATAMTRSSPVILRRWCRGCSRRTAPAACSPWGSRCWWWSSCRRASHTPGLRGSARGPPLLWRTR
jgi:hypothetical protein